jgi:peptide deformylase
MNLVSLEETKTPLQDASFPIKKEVLDEMYSIMHKNNGVGLAACQVGYFQRFFIFDLGHGMRVCCNPKLYVRKQSRTYRTQEGCLTVPGKEYFVKRLTAVKLRGFNENGQPFDWICIGRLAQVVQHEMDHLAGKCIADNADKEEVDV